MRVKRYRTRILFGLAALLGYLLSGADLKFFVALKVWRNRVFEGA